MLIGIVNGQLYIQETRPNEQSAFDEIRHLMSLYGLNKTNKLGYLVHQDLCNVIKADVFHRYFGTPLPAWYKDDKKKLDKYLKDRDNMRNYNPHYIYEDFIWES